MNKRQEDLLTYLINSQNNEPVIIGTNIKRDGYLYNPVDYERAKAFIEAARSI